MIVKKKVKGNDGVVVESFMQITESEWGLLQKHYPTPTVSFELETRELTNYMRRRDVINTLIKANGYKSYLEIGLYNPAHNFDYIKCDKKESVDPEVTKYCKPTYAMTSDDFFTQNKKKYDIIFIDGLHHHKQVFKDVTNSLKVLNEGGTIVMHDCIPTSEAMQTVPRIQGEWTGDTWKAAVKIAAMGGVKAIFVNTDYGVGVVVKDASVKKRKAVVNPTYSKFEKNKHKWLDIVTPSEFLERKG